MKKETFYCLLKCDQFWKTPPIIVIVESPLTFSKCKLKKTRNRSLVVLAKGQNRKMQSAFGLVQYQDASREMLVYFSSNCNA